MARVVFQQVTRPRESFSTSRAWIRLVIATFLLICTFFIFSIGLTFFQEWFLHHYAYPLTTVSFHLALKYLFAVISGWILKAFIGKGRAQLSWKDSITKLAPTGFAGGLDVALSNWGLLLIPVSLYTMTKSVSIIFLLLFALIFRLEKKSWSVFSIVFMIAGGLVMFTYKSTQFQLTGFILVLLASFSTGLRWTLTQLLMQHNDLGLNHPVDMMFYVQPWMFLIVWPFAIIFEGEKLLNAWNTGNQLDGMIFFLLIGGVIAFALEITEFLVVSRTSSLTLSVSGILKEIITLALAVEWNGDKLSFINFIGLLMCLGGISCHVIHKMQNVQRQQPKVFTDEASARFLQLSVNSSGEEEDDDDHSDGSSSDVLFNILDSRQWNSNK